MPAPCKFNIKLTIAYDGTRYLGWQKTKMGLSIEEVLEKKLSEVLQHDIELQAAGRTDAGVSACAQVVNFFTSKNIKLDKLQACLNAILPKDIVVNHIEEAHQSFHPTLDSKGKEYRYHVCFGRIQLPHQRTHAWHYPFPLDLSAMRAAIPLLTGQRDFSAFRNHKSTVIYAHHIRHLEKIEMHQLPAECLRFDVTGNNFLYKMVRNLVGTLVYVGCGKIKPEELPKILQSGDRTQAGMTAPAHGLFLHKVNY